jgi:hypothetical protein
MIWFAGAAISGILAVWISSAGDCADHVDRRAVDWYGKNKARRGTISDRKRKGD